MCAYYDHSCDSRALFADLEIADNPSFEKHLNKYPVIYLDMTAFVSRFKDDNIVEKIQQRIKDDVLKTYPQTQVRDDDDLMDTLIAIYGETGQKFVDNVITLSVGRADGSIFYSKTFSKASFSDYLDADYRQTGILEGFVFDKADGDWLVFAASVCHPQTDEYIPLVVRLSRMGELSIKRDSQDISVEADSIGQ